MWANLIESEARDGYGFILKGRVNDIGYKSICAPANLKMYYDAHKEHGSLPWSRVVEPACLGEPKHVVAVDVGPMRAQARIQRADQARLADIALGHDLLVVGCVIA